MTTGPTIVTARLRLRPYSYDDLEAMFEIMSDPPAMKYWSTLPHADRDVTRAWLARRIREDEAGGSEFVIERLSRAIGFVGAGTPPEFGFMLRRDFWGQGIAMEASRAFLDHAFGPLRMTELTADADPRNVASLKLLERLGFVETGRAANTFLLGDECCDSIYFRLPNPNGVPT